ncbi:hypothetical protein GX51_03061 [Blastomyces parvus]|uniref:Tse2 ADP-ribosyltransferase toxin domain-containing protein n=1 Tax=Blastomyces parvus TaxID=2060905 RepID=A0A2B7X8V7_9EURO|nr:hypothetical protein GX51_03061 [Blastomyces parvus]
MALTNRFLRSFNHFPSEIFRLNFGRVVRLREHMDPIAPPIGPFDLLTEGGKVKPRALNPATYIFPNGASMRPNSQTLQSLARKVRGDVYIYSVPAGTQLPEHLILVHEFRDHFSLQARTEMTLEDLNTRITNFLNTKGECFTRERWLLKYPSASYFWK